MKNLEESEEKSGENADGGGVSAEDNIEETTDDQEVGKDEQSQETESETGESDVDEETEEEGVPEEDLLNVSMQLLSF